MDLFAKRLLILKINTSVNQNTREQEMKTKAKTSAFALWLAELWQEHQTEIRDWEGKVVEYDMQYWFTKHKWFLKHMYLNKGNNKNDS